MRRAERQVFFRMIADEILAGRDPMAIRSAHGINYHTWARWVRSIRNDPGILLEDPEPSTTGKAPSLNLPGAKAASRRATCAFSDSTDKTRPEQRVVQPMPSLPEPIELMAEAYKMLELCDELGRAGRGETGAIRADGGAAIVNESIKRRIQVIELVVRAQEKAWSLSRMQAVHNTMMQHVARTDANVARGLIADLKAIAAEAGFGVDG